MQNEPPRILAIETSGRRGAVALGIGANLLEEVVFATDRERARDLLPCIDEAVRRQGWRPGQVQHCYVSVGPGSFTGLRVAVTFARHLALATGCKLCAVPTMDVMALNALALDPAPELVATFLDARKDQVFAAAFRRANHIFQSLDVVRMSAPAEFLNELARPIVVLGEGVVHHRTAIEAAGGIVADESLWRPTASSVLTLGWRMAQAGRFVAPQDLVPAYVRRPEAEEVWDRRQAESKEP
ncbi:MAG: tRNA (adenosine(37)-N6)-threonylcarbamoyltransferase complex dimerization subunit type 1 TsaB [Phycisphaerales bacterium]|nr:tRNA (adenosine(37)-N6)-threonylcarbamoyltransferase complex dimerization subunit type 1 TsaB [Phycisphaerales bacterium]MCB9858615.1 tRNA (adenosine(37)-N6)-threonylcarbamoyltransferase complex dimerization subunit type 1 TsaB [Phycisphaerales bacterium]